MQLFRQGSCVKIQTCFQHRLPCCHLAWQGEQLARAIVIMIESLQNSLLHLITRPLAALGLCVLVVLGLATLTSKIWSLLEFVNVYFLRPGKNLRRLGDWAAVTGATDGIGKAYAEALAKQGDVCPPRRPTYPDLVC